MMIVKLLLPFFIFIFFSSFNRADVSNDCLSHEILLSSESEPLLTVRDCVNVANGQFFQVEQDLISNGIEPLSIRRTYDMSTRLSSFMGFGFGSQYPLLATEPQKKGHHIHALISEREGFLIPYKGKIQDDLLKVDPRLLEKGYTNLNLVGVSGHSNILNWKVTYHDKQNIWKVSQGNSERTYANPRPLSSVERLILNLPSKYAFLLKEEIKSNGNRVKFEWYPKDGIPLVKSIKTLSRTGRNVLSELTFNYENNKCIVQSSCGRKATYLLKPVSFTYPIGLTKYQFERNLLRRVYTSEHPEIHYVFNQEEKAPLYYLLKVEKPNGRCIQIHYDSSGKVESLAEPLGENGKLMTTYQFDYKSKHTQVTDALDQKTTYSFDSKKRLTEIAYLDKSGQAIRQEAYEWSTKEGEDGWLKLKTVSSNGKICHSKKYSYDPKGNIIQETFYGNLTGEHHSEKYRLTYEYYPDDRHLLKRKLTPEGLKTYYEYLDGTDLCTKEFQLYNGQIQERIFRTYDENGQIVREVEDNGTHEEESDLTGVTFQKRKSIVSVTNPGASFGKPAIIIESSLDQEQIKKTEFFYDEKGNEIKQKVYNSKNQFCYETTTTYDKHGHIVEERDPLGQVTQYAYDANGNKIFESLLPTGKKTHFHYDKADRLILIEEIHNHGETFKTQYHYDPLDQLISEQDRYGQITTYLYDRLGCQIECIKPVMQDCEGKIIQPKVLKKYNALKQPIEITNENGHTTKYTYNAYGHPTSITHPDGSKEHLIYFPNGLLKQHQQSDGTTLNYRYDPKGRLIKKNHSGLKKEEYTYKGQLLTQKLDPMGIITTYEYDGSGRKSSEIINGIKKVAYQYDDFDRVTTITYSPDETYARIETFQYDHLDRVIDKTIQDKTGHLFSHETYTYDPLGNPIEKQVFISPNQIANYQAHYHSDNSLDSSKNPIEARTSWQYNHHHLNGIDQTVQARIFTDPLNRTFGETEDAYHRINRRDYYGPEGQLSITHYDFDALGNMTREHSLVMREGKPLYDYATYYHYDSQGQLIEEIISPEHSIRYLRDSMGRVIQKIYPNQNSINYTYDSLGRVISTISNDGTVSYTYTYDLHDNPIEIKDNIHQLTQKRIYDTFDRLIEEEISPGIISKYAYDNLDRLIQITLPDGSSIHYSYDAAHLRKASRYANESLQYECECTTYDMTGHLLESHSPAGTIKYEYDPLGRQTSIQTPSWKAFYQFNPMNHLVSIHQQDPDGEVKAQFQYDRFDHLSSESGFANNQYTYDSIGNCVRKNKNPLAISIPNQLTTDCISHYSYDKNGNLIAQTKPDTTFQYDALNRLIHCTQGEKHISLIYDSFGRCIQLIENQKKTHLLYYHDHEIGSLSNGIIQEFRLFNPDQLEHTLALELQQKTYFPVQDYRHQTSALYNKNGLTQWYRYSAFEKQSIVGDPLLKNPWQFANRRQFLNLTLFKHRIYNPQMMKWITPDPIKDGINRYTFLRNNPYYYYDQNGLFVFMLPILVGGFALGSELTIALPTAYMVGSVVGLAATTYACEKIQRWYNRRYEYTPREKRYQKTDTKKQKKEKSQDQKKREKGFVFPENPDDLLPELPRDEKGNIPTSDNLRIRPEKHEFEDGDRYNQRHHEQHYHVETRKDPQGSWDKRRNQEKVKPPDYQPGMGTGFLPNEVYPGIVIPS